ncbi:MAG TPA: sugar phosphate isomerase/epimerase [Terriglobia bacterium]|nr:sugar phosphate isomerase/epimerase [Terriglobia bacterium]
MRLGIFAKTFEGSDPGRVLAAAARAGFSAVQYNMACSGLPSMPDAIPSGVTLAIQSAAQAANIEIAALSGTYNMIHPDPAIRKLGHARFEVLAAAAPLLPTRLITLCTGTRDPEDQWKAHPANRAPEAWADLLASMETLVAVANRHDIDLGIEPELANVINSAEKARRLIDEIGSRRLKIVLDPANLFESAGIDDQRRIVSNAIDLLAGHIVMVHAKDRREDGGFTTAGKGVLDYPHFLSHLKSVGFDGPIVAHGLAASEAAGVARYLRRTLSEAGIKVTP